MGICGKDGEFKTEVSAQRTWCTTRGQVQHPALSLQPRCPPPAHLTHPSKQPPPCKFQELCIQLNVAGDRTATQRSLIDAGKHGRKHSAPLLVQEWDEHGGATTDTAIRLLKPLAMGQLRA